MVRDGLDPDVMDGDHNKPAKQDEDGVPLKDDPRYEKYFKMLKLGLPLGAVKNEKANACETFQNRLFQHNTHLH